MDDNTRAVWIAIVTGSVAVLTATVTVFVTLFIARRNHRLFYSQQWWERQAKAYDNTIGALADLDFLLREWQSHFTRVVVLSDQYQSELSEKRTTAENVIKKLAATGDFLITQEAARALRKTVDALEVDLGLGDVLADIKKDRDAVESCLTVVKQEARKDLKFANK